MNEDEAFHLCLERVVAIALQPIFDGVYDRGRYHARIDYTQPPPLPALSAPDQDWLKAHLQEQGGL